VKTRTPLWKRRNGKSLGQIAQEEVNKVAGVAGMVAIFAIMIYWDSRIRTHRRHRQRPVLRLQR
jgi:hypothetical protein